MDNPLAHRQARDRMRSERADGAGPAYQRSSRGTIEAYYSGFSRERAERTWATRMRILKELGFIDIKPGTNGPIHYVLLWNPYHVIRSGYEKGLLKNDAYNALKERMIEIGRTTSTPRFPRTTMPRNLRLPRSDRFAGASA